MDVANRSSPSPSGRTYRLTGRQLEVISLVVNGYSNRDLANALGISEHTAKSHLANIFGKLGVHNRLELVLIALDRKLV